MTCSSLAVPPGGRLVDLRVGPAERDDLEEHAHTTRSIHLSPAEAMDLLWRTWGAHTPDDRFEVPVGTSGRFSTPRPGEIAALRDGGGHLLALLEVEEVHVAGGETPPLTAAMRVLGTPRVLDVPVPPTLRPVAWRPAEVREVLERHDRWPVLGFYAHRPPAEPVLEAALAAAGELGGVLLLVLRLPLEEASRDQRLEEVGVLAGRLRHRAVVAAAPAPDRGLDPRDAEVRILRTYGASRVLVFEEDPSTRPAVRSTVDDVPETDFIGSLLA